MTADSPTDQQAARRTAVVGALRAAGWDCDKWEEMFAAGFSLTPAVFCELLINDRLIGIGYHPKTDDLTIQLEARTGDRIALHFYPSGPPELLATELTRQVFDLAHEDRSGQLVALIRALSPRCRRIEMETPEGFVEIEDTDLRPPQ
jgi:hypothetical protein